MKKSITKQLCVLILTLPLLLASCKKDGSSKGGSASATKAKLLTSGSWTIQDYQRKNGQGAWVSENDPNMVRYTITFYANNTYAEQGNGTLPSWSANADFSQITLGDGTDAFGTFRVVALTSTSLQLENLNPASDELYVYSH